MAVLGNAWHIPAGPEPRGRGGMRDPVGSLVPGQEIILFTGNQFQGDGNPGNQLQDGSALFLRMATASAWTQLPLTFSSAEGNNKYFATTIDAATSAGFGVGAEIQYYFQIAYDDHETSFVHAAVDGSSSTTADLQTAQGAPFSFVFEDPAVRGRWDPIFMLPNVAIHTHVLPDGRVLMWGRRDPGIADLDPHECTPFVWDPNDPLEAGDQRQAKTANTGQPEVADPTTKVNLFCGGHAFLADGELLAVGGHLFDGVGDSQASRFVPDGAGVGSWNGTKRMNQGRWYPTATTLADGSIVVLGGSFQPGQQNTLPQVWHDDEWRDLLPLTDGILDLFPRVHLLSSGDVAICGPLASTYVLNTVSGQWSPAGVRNLGQRDYAPSVMYAPDKIVYIGGGSPTNQCEAIDFGADQPSWTTLPGGMKFSRRQHNATLLPDGTIFVSGGTQGQGFNNLDPGMPVHTAELWDPTANVWTELASEEIDRCYHATTVLLPDATIFSAGSGEFKLPNGAPNDPEDSHNEAQIFHPPYLFRGSRPTITKISANHVGYRETFEVETPDAADIDRVSWIRLSSVTHSFNQNQHIIRLEFVPTSGGLTVTAPMTSAICPPGHYMLFIINRGGVPSVAPIMQITGPTSQEPAPAHAAHFVALKTALADVAKPDPYSQYEIGAADAAGRKVTVGVVSTCPYGLGACWGGAYEALRNLEDVALVNPTPDIDDSTVELFLADQQLPPMATWARQFEGLVNGRYLFRGAEITLRGDIERDAGRLFVAATTDTPRIELTPLSQNQKVQWVHEAQAPHEADEDEVSAYGNLDRAIGDHSTAFGANVTGPLWQVESAYRLAVRTFQTSASPSAIS
jgi:galactose oxidase